MATAAAGQAHNSYSVIPDLIGDDRKRDYFIIARNDNYNYGSDLMDLVNRQQLIQYLKSHGLYAKKKLGQNFLVDRGALDKIVEAAELSEEDCVIEVGPGLGVLTEELVKRAGKVFAVELDQKLAELLVEHLVNGVAASSSAIPAFHSIIPAEAAFDSTQATVSIRRIAGILKEKDPQAMGRPADRTRLPEDDKGAELGIINQDILKTNIAKLTEDCSSYKVVANIPYYITSKILRFFLEAEKKPETIVLLTQKEVAERICAKPGSPRQGERGKMSILSVSVQYYGQPEIIDIVPKTSFFPVPEVDSAILRIVVTSKSNGNEARIGNVKRSHDRQTLNDTGIATDERLTIDKEFFRCVHHGFASRRKTLLNNLSAGYRLEKKAVLDILLSVGLNEKTRAQELSIGDWQQLCGLLSFKPQITIPK